LLSHPCRPSLRQHYPTPLNLIAAKTGRRLAIGADDARLAGNRNPQVWAITWIDTFLKCD
jgi:hypothetical protein